MFCQLCGNEATDGGRFCVRCGAEMTRAAGAQPRGDSQAANAPAQAPPTTPLARVDPGATQTVAAPALQGAATHAQGAATHAAVTTTQWAGAPPARGSLTPWLGGIAVGALVAAAALVFLLRGGGGDTSRRSETVRNDSNADSRQATAASPKAAETATTAGAPGAAPRAESKIVGGELLSSDDLLGLSPAELRRLRNAVFARHGRVFESPELQQYFNSRPWYSPRASFSDAQLTANDRANIELLKTAEERPGDPAKTQPAVTASSVRSPFNGISYSPEKAVDGDLSTAWLEGAAGPGIGEWIRFDFGHEVRLERIVIAPGYFKSPQVWAKNNRVANATFSFSNGVARSFAFPDRMEKQTLELGGVTTRWVQIQIGGVYFGTDPDTAISEVSFEWE
jgi:YARHG domain/F5/8 type C domain